MELVNPDAKDLREPIMDHFGKPFTRVVDGKLTLATYWELPPSCSRSIRTIRNDRH
jgi:hypothetical protein